MGAAQGERFVISAALPLRLSIRTGSCLVARFVGNVHIVAPSNKDFSVPAPNSRTTFPEPLPHFLSRNNPIPPAVRATREPTSANAGRFSLSLKGMRRQLRSSGPRTELLVKEVEDEIVTWLAAGGVMLAPDASATFDSPGAPIGSTGAILELSRTPLQLVWNIEDNAFTRYVAHCCARYHDVVSFSSLFFLFPYYPALTCQTSRLPNHLTSHMQAKTRPANASLTSSARTSPARRATPPPHSTPHP